MKKKYYVGIAVFLLIIIVIIIFRPGKSDAQFQLAVKVEKGEFEILVTTTGELQAKSSVNIMGPTELRNSRSIRIRNIKIQDLVAEGTVVDSGEYVGELDRSEVGTSLKDLEDELEDAEVRISDFKSEIEDIEYELNYLKEKRK